MKAPMGLGRHSFSLDTAGRHQGKMAVHSDLSHTDPTVIAVPTAVADAVVNSPPQPAESVSTLSCSHSLGRGPRLAKAVSAFPGSLLPAASCHGSAEIKELKLPGLTVCAITGSDRVCLKRGGVP